MPRRICLAIGAGTVSPGPGTQTGFAILDGAAVAARCLGAWAVAAGFGEANVQVVTDDRGAGPVTADRVKQAVASLFADGAEPVGHMVLSFCGHGTTGAEVGSIFWLLSDALEQQYRVNVDWLVSELLKYRVPRLTLISDACRDGPADLEIQRLEARRLLIGPRNTVKSPQFDRLTACQDGKAAFMVGDNASALPGKCIFSGVVADILWTREAAGSADGAVTTLGLGATARSRATERANDYKLELYPQCLVDPLPATLVAAGQHLPLETDPQPWPILAEGQIMGSIDLGRLEMAEAGSPRNAIERITKDARFRGEVLGVDFGKDVADLDFSKNFSGFPDKAAGSLLDLIKLRTIATSARVGTAIQTSAAEQLRSSLRQLEASAAAKARRKVAEELKQTSARLIGMEWGSRANLVALGGSDCRFWGAEDARVSMSKSAARQLSAWRIDAGKGQNSVVMQIDDEMFLPITLVDGLCTTVSPDPRGGYIVAYGSREDPDVLGNAFNAIAAIAAGTLSPVERDEFVAQLPTYKHVDPVLGVIAAYLYRAAADVDSIRRIAYFYQQNGQAVPFDIVLLGELTVTRAIGSGLVAAVPAIQARSDASPSLPAYVVRATDEVDVRVGGLTPWLSVGWDYIADPAPEWTELVDGLATFAPRVMRSGFTNLPIDVGKRLIEFWGLQRIKLVVRK